MIQTLFHDLKQYYRGICFEAAVKKGLWPFNPLKKDMEEYVSAHPDITPFQVKAGLYDIIAEKCTPVLFKNDPFFFEVGLKMAEYDGHSSLSSGGWMFLNRFHLMKDLDPEGWNQYYSGGNMGLHLTFNIFDIDHHGFPYRNVLKNGLSGLYSQITEKLNTVNDPRKTDFYEAAKKGILAVKKIADRFSAEAERLAEQETDAAARETYLKAAAAAGRVPWNPAETFYEGLAVIWFLHEIGSVMDGIGMAIIGSPDDLLHDLYKHDVENGAETPESAEQLLKIWMIHTDCKLDFTKPGDKQFNAGEQGDTLTIGKDVNELTYMILKIHRELNLIYPKIHCRVNAASPEKYLREACRTFFDGKNTLDFLNDDLIIPAQILSGKDRADAERYVVGGCWEIMLSECEHAQGANCYFDLARVMDLSIQSTEQEEQSLGLHFERFDHADSFETLYGIVMRNVKMCLNQVFASLRKFGSLWPEINPAPFFSACMTGCIESGKDYSEGGAKYSPHSIPLTDAAAFVNSLLVLRELCFHTKKYELSEILNAVRSNWKGAEALRGEQLKVSHLGDGNGDAAALLKRILNELADFIAPYKNERDGAFQCGLYSYVEVVCWAGFMRATPDGRHDYDFLAQGITPTRLHPDNITDVLRDLSELPLERFPANSVATVSLSLNGLDSDRLVSLLKTWCKLKSSGMLQLNCLSREELEDAVIHPEKHQNLIVRLYGYSTRFVTVEKIKQKEFLSRQILK